MHDKSTCIIVMVLNNKSVNKCEKNIVIVNSYLYLQERILL